MITIEQVIEQVEEIRRLASSGADARADVVEDSLYVDVLETIAAGRLTAPEMADLAAEACKTGDVEFSRYAA